ncbi:MAG: transposase [Prosthecobacter sp.]|jgi:putative transposase|uniref:transposase n=1 Tax=Prosthecobacter sp. TaxID=1965333 RepID=UPI0019E35985|nr:transposase [Prosthecobacter sp.]MBE2286549.1 transposase [Prosthecobacter sp.]
MKTSKSPENQSIPLEEQLVGINAKTAPYPAARSWSGGRRRILGKGPLESYTYHVMSRTCGGEVFWDDVEKEALRRLLWKMAEFSGVRLVTYCIMGNHFHALVDVPKREIWLERFVGVGGEEKLFEHLRTLYSREFVGLLRQEIGELRRLGMHTLASAKLEAIKKRFCDLSIFVKEVKERYSRWFNKRRGRKGTLWMDRYKSVMVEGKGEPLHTMAAYIDLNPVRAGLVKDPKDYRWCGYAEAVSGSRRAQRGLSKVTAKPVDGWEAAGGAEAYRCLLFSTGVEVKDAQNENAVRQGVTAEEARQVLKEKGRLSNTEMVRLRVRYFSDGLVLGSKKFVETVFIENRDKFGPKRRDGARRIAESAGGLFALRRLRKRSVG